MTFAGHVKTTAGAAVTVNVAEHVLGPSHELLTVKTTVAVPPHADAAAPLLFEIAALHPPENCCWGWKLRKKRLVVLIIKNATHCFIVFF